MKNGVRRSMVGRQFPNRQIIFYFFVALFAVGCVGQQEPRVRIITPVATPTLHSIFASSTGEFLEQPGIGQVEGTPTLMSFFGPSSTPISTRTPMPVNTTSLSTPTPRPTDVIKDVFIFDESLNVNWTMENSFFVDYDVRDDDFSYNGRYSIGVTPETGNGRLMFTVDPDSEEEYLRQNVLAVQFWLYSGDDYIATDDLSVTIIGSNEYPYFVANDDSVVVDDALPTFPQTRLYYLGILEDIPPDTWVQVEVWLDDLIYDPDYQYVTGVIIENDDNFLQKFYLDDLELVIAE
ncbi:MAG: hypothetical protein WAM60_21020 [Candidatus Promineifilaceae bacterium]